MISGGFRMRANAGPERASPCADRYNLITNCLIINVKKAERSDAARSTSRDKIPSLKLVKRERRS